MSDHAIVDLGPRGRVACRQRGPASAPALLLVRPLGGTMALWGELEARLAERHRVIAYDPRGVGRSDDAAPGTTTRGMAADARALLDALAVPRAHVFGLSLGGMVASWLAIDAPERVDRLILASTLARSGSISRRVTTEALPFVRWFLMPGRGAEPNMVRNLLSPRFRRAQPARVRAILDEVRRAPTRRRNLWRLALAAAGHDAEPRLREIVAPTLLIVGALDPVVGASSQRELMHGIPHARLELVLDAGHDLSLEAPAETAALVLAFLAERR